MRVPGPARARAEGVGRAGPSSLARGPSHSERPAADTRGPYNYYPAPARCAGTSAPALGDGGARSALSRLATCLLGQLRRRGAGQTLPVPSPTASSRRDQRAPPATVVAAGSCAPAAGWQVGEPAG